MTSPETWPGNPFPLGPVWDGSGTNFSLFSENAERVELCLFDEDDAETRVEVTESACPQTVRSVWRLMSWATPSRSNG